MFWVPPLPPSGLRTYPQSFSTRGIMSVLLLLCMTMFCVFPEKWVGSEQEAGKLGSEQEAGKLSTAWWQVILSEIVEITLRPLHFVHAHISLKVESVLQCVVSAGVKGLVHLGRGKGTWAGNCNWNPCVMLSVIIMGSRFHDLLWQNNFHILLMIACVFLERDK